MKNLLEEEEKTNAKLKTDLYTQKDENIERTRKISQAKLSPKGSFLFFYVRLHGCLDVASLWVGMGVGGWSNIDSSFRTYA